MSDRSSGVRSRPLGIATFLLCVLVLASPSFAQLTAPIPITPAGTTSDTTPTYEWTVVSGATWYQLWVNDSTGTVVNRWYTASQVNASSGECSVTPAEAVASGNATWWVRAWNQQSGNGPWSGGMAFLMGSPLTAPTQIAPAGTTSDPTPTYRWSVVSGATWYQLWVSGSTGTVVNRWYTASQVNASSGECSVTPAEAVDSGNATWWVRAWNASQGNGPWSGGMAFAIQTPSVPTVPSCDDFITMAPTGWWNPLQSSPLALQVVQAGDRVRFVSTGAGNGFSIAGLLGEPWRLDLGVDFKIRGTFAVAFPSIPNGECGLNLAVSLGGSPVGAPWSGFVVDIGQSFGWNYRGVVVYLNGVAIQEAYEPLPPNGGSGTVYIRYSAATDTFSVGLSGYDGPQLFSYSGLRGLTGSQQAAVWLGAFAEFTVPSFGGQTAVIDQFCIDAGAVLVP